MNILIKADNGGHVEMSEEEMKIFCMLVLKVVEFTHGQDKIDKVVAHYLGGEEQPPYELMLQ